MTTISIIYDFNFSDQTHVSYVVKIDNTTLTFQSRKKEKPPSWTQLENHKCKHCPLNAKETPHCPVAANLSHLVEKFKNKASYQTAEVKVTTAERIYMKTLSLQEGIFSIFGLIMATSNCPYMDFLKPMARFHLPFSSPQETIVRTVSMHLLRQYFVYKRGKQPDLSLDQLEALYANIQKVNEGILNRIRATANADADVNAVVIFHNLTELLNTAIENDLSNIEHLFT